MAQFFIAQAFGHNGLGRATENAGTVINRLVPAQKQGKAIVTALKHTDGGTAHLVTALRPIGEANLAAAAATGQAAVVLDADPSPSGNTIASGDYCVIHFSADDTQRVAKVSTWTSASKTLTFDANIPVAGAIGDKLWMMGVATDTDPATGNAHPRFQSNQALEGAIAATIKAYQPILVQIDNGTTAGTTNYVQYAYAR